MVGSLATQERAEELASQLPPLLVAAERVAASVAQGVHGRRRIGQGETFWQFRRYQFGDGADEIDWRQSAKTDRLYVRETEWEAAQSVWLWRDGSASMRWRSTPNLPEKIERADLIALALTALVVRGGEQVALIGEGAGPRSGRAALTRIAQALARPASGQANGPGLPPPAPISRHGEVVLIGDFLSPLAEIDRAVRKVAGAAITGHLVHVLDPAEETLPFAGRTRFEGLEDEGETLIPRVESVREDYRRLLAEHVQGLGDIARASGWTFHSHRTDHSVQPTLLALYLALAYDPRSAR